MRPIKLQNDRLKTLLSTITELAYNSNLVEVISKTRNRLDDLLPNLYGVSDEYLHAALQKDVREYGFPRSCWGLGMNNNFDPRLYERIKPVTDQVSKIGKFLGTPTNALTMMYPDNGYIGWHHNGNAPGYNILMSYSQDGDGDFRYWDSEKKEIVILKDTPGWFVKVGYYPSDTKEAKRVYWHAAQTKKQRVSIAWILNHRDMWMNMIHEITGGDYDKDYILSQGPINHLKKAGFAD